MKLLLNILKKIFYSPEYHFRRLPFAHKDPSTTFIGPQFTFVLSEKEFKGRIEIGKNTIFGGQIIFESNQGEVLIGDHCFVNGGSKFITRSRITLGSNVTIAWGCTLYDHNSHSFDHFQRKADIIQQIIDLKHGHSMLQNKNWEVVKSREIIISDNVWIGFDSVILSGVTIGEGAIIGARSVVRKNVEPWTMVAGNPAVTIRRLN